MIALILLAALLGAGGLIYLVQLGGSTPAIVETLISPLTLSVERLFTILGYLAPLLVAIVPLYLVLNSKSMGKDRRQMVVFGAVFGLALYGMAIFTGLDTLLTQEMRSSFMVGNTLGIAATTLGAAAEWVLGFFTGLLLWGAGLVLVFIGGVLDALVGVGEAAKHGKRGVSRAQRGILDRLGR